jgi:hypothetical protein
MVVAADYEIVDFLVQEKLRSGSDSIFEERIWIAAEDLLRATEHQANGAIRDL